MGANWGHGLYWFCVTSGRVLNGVLVSEGTAICELNPCVGYP
jgi:hypothetical protein